MNTGVKKTKKVSTKQSAKERRKRVIERLENQLKSNKKHTTAPKTDFNILEEKDIERIKNEINILKQRI